MDEGALTNRRERRMDVLDDREIIELLFARDQRALEELTKDCRARALKTAREITGSAEDAEECFDDALLRVWERIPPERPASVKFYLFSIARNLALDRFREKKRSKRGGGAECLPLEELSEVLGDVRDVEGAIEEKLFTEALDRFLDGLKPRSRAVFLRRYFYMEETKEISSALGLSETHVFQILSRTRAKLKKFLRQEGYSI